MPTEHIAQQQRNRRNSERGEDISDHAEDPEEQQVKGGALQRIGAFAAEGDERSDLRISMLTKEENTG
jgi:hypothetical protein